MRTEAAVVTGAALGRAGQGLDGALLAARIAPMIPAVHTLGHAFVPALVEGNLEILSGVAGRCLGSEYAPRPVPVRVADDEVVGVVPDALEHALDAHADLDEVHQLGGDPLGHRRKGSRTREWVRDGDAVRALQGRNVGTDGRVGGGR